jgi:hypothetical protein
MQKTQKQALNNKQKAAERHAEFIQFLKEQGLPISAEQQAVLEQYGFSRSEEPVKEKEIKIDESVVAVTEESKIADEFISIIEGNGINSGRSLVEVVANDDVIQDLVNKTIHGGGKEIRKADWFPKDRINHDKEFVAWIDSINEGFQSMVRYKPFDLYCKQAEIWLSEDRSISDCTTEPDMESYIDSELFRCDENSYYFLDRYIHVKEGDLDDGYMQYRSAPVHKVIAFLFDCGYSFEMGKPRQIAATTTIGALSLKKLIFNQNFFIKFIAQDEAKVQEIFSHKVKYPFSELPVWMRPKVYNDTDNKISFKSKTEKGKIDGLNSELLIVPPSVGAINGGSPQLVLIDEAGYISMLGKMIKEARPTMYRKNTVTGALEMQRQIIIWGTGGEMDRAGKAYEIEYMNTIKKWKERDFSYGIIPLFFDWTTRPGITKEFYESEKKAYTIDGPEAEERMVQFRQAYPDCIEDMFLSSHKTIVPSTYINKNIKKINDMPHNQRPRYGYFEPIYDYSKPCGENSDTPYDIIGAEFIPTEVGDPRASAVMFIQNNRKYDHRFYQGTDPVSSDNGVSKMATSIWDHLYKTVACIVNYRESNHKNTYLQVYLAGLYYNTTPNKKRIRELVEGNVGQNYMDYVELKGDKHSVLYNTELIESLQGGGMNKGIDNHRGRNRIIINYLHELLVTYGDRIYIRDIWDQLRTFVVSMTDKGNETWGSVDKRNYPDDVLFAVVYSYICALSVGREPVNIEEVKTSETNVRYRHVLKRNPDGTLYRQQVKVKMYD